jgi:peptide/nickel transport system permease protein
LPTAIVFLTLVVAIFAPALAPHSAVDADLRARGKPPLFLEGGEADHLLGTDRQGRDILSRIIVGTRISLSVAALSILVGGVVGTGLGLLAGYRGGWVDALIMRTVDLTLAFPSILLALIFAVTMNPSFWVVVAVLGFILWARYARLVRGEVLAWKQLDFVALARMAGCSLWRIIGRHLLPNVVNSVVVLSTLQVGWAIVVEASLSFLGAGIPPPAPTWGGMVSEGRKYLETLWWVSVFPGVAIMLVVLSFNMFGDWLRDILDPKLRQL